MIARRGTTPLSWRLYSAGVLGLAVVSLTWDEFVLGQPVPKWFPHRAAFAYAAGAFMLVAAGALQWRRTVARGAAALAAYYVLVVVVLMNGRVILHNAKVFVAYSGTGEQLSIGLGAVVIYAATGSVSAKRGARLTRLAQRAFGVCALLFGGAHFVYMNMTAPLVPKWLPPSQIFWGYATGVGFVAAGVALLTGVRARLAATLLTVMIAAFALLVHVPMVLAERSLMNVTEAAVNLSVLGAAWVVADSLEGARG